MPGLVGNGTWPECYMSRGSLPLAMYCVLEREKRIDIALLRLRCVLRTVPDPVLLTLPQVVGLISNSALHVYIRDTSKLFQS
jgi:hypothetical protein